MQRPRYIFLLMFSVFLLLNLNYTILRSLRTTLAVIDSGTHSIPIFEFFGAMPGALLMTWCLVHLLNRFSIENVFLVTIATFIAFFLVFDRFIYPYLPNLKKLGGNWNWIVQLLSMLFYVISELWKPALAIILFWGLVNQYTPSDEAKKLYAPLMLGGSLGSIIAGPMISLCTSEKLWKKFSPYLEQWIHSFHVMVALIAFLGMFTAYLYYQLWKTLSRNLKNPSGSVIDKNLSLKNSIHLCLENHQLRLLSWIVIADYISYSLGEVIFLEIVRIHFPKPSDYCNYMGRLSMWTGVLTFISSIFITPFILKNYRWIVAFLITPFCLLATEGAFFIFLRGSSGWSEVEWVGLASILGSVQYCLCRAAKYTLFDASKELAFVLMPESQRMQGKLVVDGLCARLGRGSASILSIGLIKICGGVIASSFFTGLIAISMVLSWLCSAFKLGKIIDRPIEKISL